MSPNDEGLLGRFTLDFIRSRLPKGADFFRLEDRFREELGLSSMDFLSLSGDFSASTWIEGSGAEDYLLRAKRPLDWVTLLKEVPPQENSTMGFFSSGSTGEPKHHRHSWKALLKEVGFWDKNLRGKSPESKIISTVPSHHIYGFLFTILLPELAQIELLDVRSRLPASVRPSQGDLVVTHPYYLAQMLKGSVEYNGVRFIISTAPCPIELLEKLSGRGALYTQIYGSTETAGLGWREDGELPYQPLPWWDFHEEVAFRDKKEYVLPDYLEFGPGGFVPRGRKDDAIVIAGHNVIPRVVQEKILEIQGVQDALVQVYESPEGPKLRAYVATSLRRTELLDVARTMLSEAERPSQWGLGSLIPRNSMGKKFWPETKGLA